MSQDMDKYKDLFIQESKERLEELERLILDLEKDPENKAIVKDMFRTAHTFKGMAATMGYNNMAHMTHQMENLMSLVDKGGHTADDEMISLLFECRDILATVIMALENGEAHEMNFDTVIERLESNIKKFSATAETKDVHTNQPSTPVEYDETALEKTPTDSLEDDLFDDYKDQLELTEIELDEIDRGIHDKKSLFLVKIKLFDDTEMKYARAYLCIKNIKDFGDLIKLLPNEEKIKEEAFGTKFQAVLLISDEKKIKYLRQDIESVAAVENVDIIKIKQSVGEDKESSLMAKKSKLMKERDFSIQNVKVSIRHLDSLMNLTGELLITKIRLDKIAQKHNINELNESLNLINRITFDLQDEVLQMRMIPVSHIFDRFPRMVRDLTKKMGKMIDFSMEGRDIELDRTIIDQLGDPLVHLLRNAIDHGIEQPDEREQAGKTRIASLKLMAYRDKNFVIIEVADDGQGIDFEKIKQKALDKNLINPEDAEKMTDYDLKRLLLGGGISTASKVSEISGRGVGLGVVKQKIENLGGIIEVDSKLGEGTTFRLKLPLTVAIIKSLLVGLGSKQNEEIFAIPITNVVRTIVINEKEIRTIKKKEVITILGKIVSLVRLRELVNFKNQTEEDQRLQEQKMKTVIVIERSGMEVGLLVDNLIGQQEIVIKNLGGLLKGVKGISGGAILGDGKVALIIDVSSLF